MTTFRREGTPVATPVNIAVSGERAFFRTYGRSGKARRLRNAPGVEIAPSTFRGRPTGPAIKAHARLLDADEARTAAALLARKHRILQGVLVPLLHRLARYQTLHYELTPRADDGD